MNKRNEQIEELTSILEGYNALIEGAFNAENLLVYLDEEVHNASRALYARAVALHHELELQADLQVTSLPWFAEAARTLGTKFDVKRLSKDEANAYRQHAPDVIQ